MQLVEREGVGRIVRTFLRPKLTWRARSRLTILVGCSAWLATGLTAASASSAASGIVADRLVPTLTAAAPEHARASSRWAVIARTEALRDDRDVVRIDSDDRFTAIRLQALDGRVRLREVTVEYRNGKRETWEPRDELLRDGDRPIVFSLPEPGRLKQVYLSYRSLNGRTNVELSGQVREGRRTVRRERKRGVLIARAEAKGADDDVIRVEDGRRYAAIGVRAVDRGVFLEEVRFVFRNGKEETVRPETRIRARDDGWVHFLRRPRRIELIYLSYKSFGRTSNVEIYGSIAR